MAQVPFQRRTPKIGRPGRRGWLGRGLALAAVVLVSLLPAVPAQADPTVDEIEAMIDKQWVQLEPTIEQYNKVHSPLKANQKKSADAAEEDRAAGPAG